MVGWDYRGWQAVWPRSQRHEKAASRARLCEFGEECLHALARDALGSNANCVTNPRSVTEADAKAI